MQRRLSVTGAIYLIDSQGKIRIDYNPNQPRDARGRWSSGGGGGKSKGGGGAILDNKKVSELQAIAKEKGIDIDRLSYKNRKSILISAIKGKDKDKDLRQLGLLKPQKTTFKKPENKQSQNLESKEIASKGGKLASRFNLDEKLPVSEREKAILQKAKEITDRRKEGKGDPEKDLIAIKVLQRELIKEREKNDSIRIQKHKEVRDEIIAHNKFPVLKARSLLRNVDLSGLNDSQKKEVSALLVEFHQLTNGAGAKSIKKVVAERDRAYTNPNGLVDVGKATRKADIFHELAHHIEISDPAKAKLAAQWRDAKSDGSGTHKLSDLTGEKGYRDTEIAVRDKYYDPYVGKVYGSGFTEVISMGIEHFSSPEKMKKLYDKDPDHYHFIVGLLMK